MSLVQDMALGEDFSFDDIKLPSNAEKFRVDGEAPIDSKIWSLFGLPICYGILFTFFCHCFFGYAVHKGWTSDLTPRISNRPKKVLVNAMLFHLPEFMKGSAMWYPIAWIGWAYNLTYIECLKGIPGTGTRKDGFEGLLLKTNLDAVILMKFHTLMFKVAVLVTFLGSVIAVVNATSTCDIEKFGIGTCHTNVLNTTGFKQTTLWNIPPKLFNNFTNETTLSNDITQIEANETTLDVGIPIDELWIRGVTWRVMMTVLSCILIYFYICYLLWWEWIENVTLRRKFYLEANLHSDRMGELKQLAIEKCKRDDARNLLRSVNSHYSTESEEVQASRLRQYDESDRPEYLPHPEITETPPSIGIFSVLYQLPKSMITYDTDGATPMERKLVTTTNFFDEVIPPSSGFSSSVAAVTILPNANLVARAQTKWDVCETMTQKLRYIRKRIRLKENPQEECSFRKDQPKEKSLTRGGQSYLQSDLDIKTMEDGVHVDIEDTDKELPPTTLIPNGVQSSLSSSPTANNNNGTQSFKKSVDFKYENFNLKEYASSIGFHEEVHEMVGFVDGMGIEEFNVFAYKCAELAGYAPGINKKKIDMYGIEVLRKTEVDIIKKLREAISELAQTRENVAMYGKDKAVDDKAIIRQPSVEYENLAHTTENHKGYKLSGELSTGIRKRPTSALRDIRESNESADVGDGILPDDGSERSTKWGKRLWRFFECLRSIPIRVYRGKDDSLNYNSEKQKYYGIAPTDCENHGKGFVTNLSSPAYAVVTFTNRNAAVIARQCLADGGARNNWKSVDDIPIYPLAGATSLNILRPVTPTISFESKKFRRVLVYSIWTAFTMTWLYIVHKINKLILHPEFLSNHFGIDIVTAISFTSTLAGLTKTALFSICPSLFLLLANAEGSATSMEKAEQKALLYFWYFFIIAQFLGQIVWNMIIDIWFIGIIPDALLGLGILRQMATSVPTVLGPINAAWIISYVTISWPAFYFLQLPNLCLSFLRLDYFKRCMFTGGGSGDCVPYRIYIDNGYVFACMTALAPLCPLIGPCALLYFTMVAPMLRWLLVFQYRPDFDGGGDKWPKLHHIIMTSLILGQVITAASLFFLEHTKECVIILLCIPPTLFFNHLILEKYSRPYQDAALLQTGRMRSEHLNSKHAWLQREEYRRWLVDCHKASYLPTCLSGMGNNLLTSEPAVVIIEPPDREMLEENRLTIKKKRWSYIPEEHDSFRNMLTRQEGQKGGILHRQRFNI